MAGKLINNELERTCKEADVAQFDVLTSTYWADWDRPPRKFSQYRECLGQGMNPGSLKYGAEVLPFDCNARLGYIYR